MEDREFKELVAEAEKHVGEAAPKKWNVASGMFRPLRGKFENMAEGYLYELSEKYGESLPTVMAEAHRVTNVAVRVDVQLQGDGREISWAWIAVAYVINGGLRSELFHEIETDDEVSHFLDCIVLVFLTLASVHIASGRVSAATSCLFEATEARRLSELMLIGGQKSKDVLSQLGKAGAAARHKENYSLKQDVFTWCQENFSKYRSMDAAASAIVDSKLVPVVFRTVRNWVGEWKKQRPTGRP